MPMNLPPEPLGDGARRAGAEEGIEHHVAGLRRGDQNAMQQRFRLLRRMRLAAAVVLQPLRSRADRKQPVGAHLQIVVRAPSWLS